MLHAADEFWENYRMDISFNHELDTSGTRCPEPVMMLHGAVRRLLEGEVIKVIATDPATTRDIPKFCRFLGYQLLEHSQSGTTYLYYIQKKSV